MRWFQGESADVDDLVKVLMMRRDLSLQSLRAPGRLLANICHAAPFSAHYVKRPC
jgi:hypothetical protein